MKFGKLALMRNRLHLAIFIGILALAAAGAAYLAIGAGANVNCIDGTCNSTNGQTDNLSPYDTDTVFTDDNDTASISGAGAGTYSGGGGNDTFYVNLTEVGTINGEDGDDVILDSSTVDGNFLNGGDGNDFIANDASGRLYGGAGNDLLAGGQDNDTLDGGDGNDVIIGGPGDDTFATDDADDDIYIIHKGDVDNTDDSVEEYTCFDGDTILLFGFNMDLVLTLTDATPPRNYGFDPNLGTPPCDNDGEACFADPVNNPRGDPNEPYYFFDASAGNGTCTIIVVD